MSAGLEGRPDKLPDGSWGAWVTGDPEAVTPGAAVLIVTEGGKQWTAPVVEVVARCQETGETLVLTGRGSPSEPADPDAWKRRMDRAERARRLMMEQAEAGTAARRPVWRHVAGVVFVLAWVVLIVSWCS